MIALPHGTPIYRAEDIRRIEACAAAAPESPRLMERAGLAAAELARDLASGTGKAVLVVAGPGDNGGDALVLARHLKEWWFNVSVVFTGDEQKLSPDAAAAFAKWRAAGGDVMTEPPRAQHHALIVDGLFGIGLERELGGSYAALVSWMNGAGAPVLALDVPSGLDSDTGRVLGCAVHASHTMTFIGLKAGLLTLDGPEHCGELRVATLGLDAAQLVPPRGSVIGPAVLESALPPRRLNSHKGDYGSVGIIGGARGMGGAALLAGRAALKVGAGRVYVGFADEDHLSVDPLQPELMLRGAEEVLGLDPLASLAVGPGLGRSRAAEALVRSAVTSSLPLVLDADALNLVAAHEPLRAALIRRDAPAILTPHPAEAARLLGVTTPEVQRDRVAAALALAATYRCGTVLKGAGSVCAWPDGRWAINTSGNPGMASAGMGDVLTGVIAALLAQGASAEVALTAGVYLHGAAGDAAVASAQGPLGLTASDVADAARALLNQS